MITRIPFTARCQRLTHIPLAHSHYHLTSSIIITLYHCHRFCSLSSSVLASTPVTSCALCLYVLQVRHISTSLHHPVTNVRMTTSSHHRIITSSRFTGSTLKHCMRQFHPFPIFERWADKDVTEATVLEMCNGNRHSSNLSSSQKSLNGDEDNVVSSSSGMRDNDDDNDGDGDGGEDRVLVPANTHCIMFTSGFFCLCICDISFCCASSISISISHPLFIQSHSYSMIHLFLRHTHSSEFISLSSSPSFFNTPLSVFSSLDFRGQEFNWPIFGGGIRSCPGRHTELDSVTVIDTTHP